MPEWNLDVHGNFFREEDEERIAKNTAFTPQVALSHLGVVQKDVPARLPSNSQTATAIKPHEELEKSSVPSNGQPFSTLKSVWVLVIAAAMGLLWLVLKNRRR